MSNDYNGVRYVPQKNAMCIDWSTHYIVEKLVSRSLLENEWVYIERYDEYKLISKEFRNG